MSIGQIKIKFICPSCGADPTTLELPDGDNDDSIAYCKVCGVSFGRYGDIKKKAADAASDATRRLLEKALEGVDIVNGVNVRQ